MNAIIVTLVYSITLTSSSSRNKSYSIELTQQAFSAQQTNNKDTR